VNSSTRSRRSERGGALVLVSVSLFALMGVAALAIDLAMLMDARAEAQRAADATALGGAEAFRDFPKDQATPFAIQQALDVAAANEVRRTPISVANKQETNPTYNGVLPVTTVTTDNVVMNVIPDSERVRVWIKPPAGITTFFARTFGWGMGAVQAMATAEAAEGAETVNCLKPFLLPDMWYEASRGAGAQDADSDGLMDGDASDHFGGERWFFEPSNGDYYARYDPSVTNPSPPQTGYGSGRAGYTQDWGTPMLIKPQTGNAQRQGNFYFTLDDPEYSTLRDQIKFGCMEAAVGDVPEQEQGGKTGQARQGTQYLVDDDPTAVWDPESNTVINSRYGGRWTSSKRTIIIGLFDPNYLLVVEDENDKLPSGVSFTNFARMWIEDVDGNDNIIARFLGFVPGGEGGPVEGTTVKKIRLIQ
jgi:hypothetical protein